MVKSARREYLEAIRRRYRKACGRGKKPILDELCTDYGNHRRSLTSKTISVNFFYGATRS